MAQKLALGNLPEGGRKKAKFLWQGDLSDFYQRNLLFGTFFAYMG